LIATATNTSTKLILVEGKVMRFEMKEQNNENNDGNRLNDCEEKLHNDQEVQVELIKES
jgi:hypothetical protein